MKLISMTYFVLKIAKEREEYESNYDDSWFYTGFDFEKCMKYARFLKEPLKLEMFVPCDEEGNVLEEPQKIRKLYDIFHPNHVVNLPSGKRTNLGSYEDKYKKAKEKVLFDGFKIEKSNISEDSMNVIHYSSSQVWIRIYPENKYAKKVIFNYPSQCETLEDFATCNLELTNTALKKLGIHEAKEPIKDTK